MRNILILLMLCHLQSTRAAEFDLVIQGGIVVDGTGNPWFRADVGIKGDRIAKIGKIPASQGERVLQAHGLIVAPGFIDIHSHSDTLLLKDGKAQSKIRQGVTTEVLGEGKSAGPYRIESGEEPNNRFGSIGAYLEAVEKSKVAVNVATYVGMDNVWEFVMGESHVHPNPEQFQEMKKILDQSLNEGAFGMSSLLAMPPGSLATRDEIASLCEVVAAHGGLFSTHHRNEGLGVLEGVAEAIAVGEKSGVRVDIIHLKIADQKLWGRMDEVVQMIEQARARGVDVQANVYPYTRGNNNLASIIPPWAHEGGNQKFLERLVDPEARKKMKQEIRDGIPGWYNHYTAVGGDWGRMLISGQGPYQGLTMDRILKARSENKTLIPDPLDELFDILIEQGGSLPTVYEHHTEKDMNLAMFQEWCSIGSDGSAYATEGPLRIGNPHPRNFGTFPRVLGVYVRERKLLSLEAGIRKMTSLNARKLGLRDRGLLREGMLADLTIFDPVTIIDKSSYEDPFHYSEGVSHVIVNGTLVLENGEHTGALPGRALRHSP